MVQVLRGTGLESHRRQNKLRHKEGYIKHSIFVKPACGERDTVVITSVRCMCVRVLYVVRAFIRICPGHSLYIYAWISK